MTSLELPRLAFALGGVRLGDRPVVTGAVDPHHDVHVRGRDLRRAGVRPRPLWVVGRSGCGLGLAGARLRRIDGGLVGPGPFAPSPAARARPWTGSGSSSARAAFELPRCSGRGGVVLARAVALRPPLTGDCRGRRGGGRLVGRGALDGRLRLPGARAPPPVWICVAALARRARRCSRRRSAVRARLIRPGRSRPSCRSRVLDVREAAVHVEAVHEQQCEASTADAASHHDPRLPQRAVDPGWRFSIPPRGWSALPSWRGRTCSGG